MMILMDWLEEKLDAVKERLYEAKTALDESN